MHAKNPELTVILSADKMARFRDVVDVLDIISELGITKLNIAVLNQQ